NQLDLLRRYQQERGCFNTYLRVVASRVIQQGARSQHDALDEAISLGAKEPIGGCGDQALAQAKLADFRDSLPAQQRRCLNEKLLGEPQENPEAPPLSDANVRQLKHRLEQKAEEFFDTP